MAGSLIAIIVIATVLIYKATRPKQNQPFQLPSTYFVQISELNDKYQGTLTSVSPNQPLNAQILSQYLSISFNNTGDSMSVYCPLGYQNSSTTSNQKLNILHDPAVGSNISVTQGQTENFTINCSRVNSK